ncbi:hypothetical protein TNCV_1900151 [Trichonephila clavipes]|nr:hypothetical protein TNCV_1900151 [Trichonephila clavipes]
MKVASVETINSHRTWARKPHLVGENCDNSNRVEIDEPNERSGQANAGIYIYRSVARNILFLYNTSPGIAAGSNGDCTPERPPEITYTEDAGGYNGRSHGKRIVVASTGNASTPDNPSFVGVGCAMTYMAITLDNFCDNHLSRCISDVEL